MPPAGSLTSVALLEITVDGISTASKEQANGIEDLMQFTAGMDRSTQQSATVAEDGATSAAATL